MIPEIVIGEKYLWRAKAIEKLCPSCGKAGMTLRDGKKVEVTVISDQAPGLRWHCCGYIEWNANTEGWYGCQEEGMEYLHAVPYTQLTRLEVEDERL